MEIVEFCERMSLWRWVLLAGAVSNFCAGLVMCFIVLRLHSRQKMAYMGDRVAANHLVLPCFMPIFYFVVLFFFMLSIVCFSLVFVGQRSSAAAHLLMIQYKLFACCLAFAGAPVLLTQKSISVTSGKRVFLRLLPWFATTSAIWFVYVFAARGIVNTALQVVFLGLSSIMPIIFCCMLLGKLIWCRVKFASASNRSAILHLLLFSLLFLVFNVSLLVRKTEESLDILAIATVAGMYCAIIMFPTTIYRTFLADTKFWRGLGRHNRGGIRKSASDSTLKLAKAGTSPLQGRSDGTDGDVKNCIRESEMNVSTASKQFQDMMNDISDVMIDFAFIELGPVIGHGASAEVIYGKYQTKTVAIKVSAPPEITEEVLDSFYAEALVTSTLYHENIVKFYGICVKPPEIGMVIEYCSHGNLKDSLVSEAAQWTTRRRVLAATHAARAIAYMHSQNIIHRDIKADNFFVDDQWNVKLGDFGESVFKQRYEPGRRMTVLGTVAFMAPELVEGKPVYTEAIDVYALGITLWEIWTGEDPFDSSATFSIYSKVMSGERPYIPDSAPPEYVDVMCKAWDQDPVKRPTATEIAVILEGILATCVKDQPGSHSPDVLYGVNDTRFSRDIELTVNPVFEVEEAN